MKNIIHIDPEVSRYKYFTIVPDINFTSIIPEELQNEKNIDFAIYFISLLCKRIGYSLNGQSC